VVRDDGQLWHQEAGPEGWSGWDRVAGPAGAGRATSVAGGSRGDGDVEVVVSDTHGCAWSRRRGAAGGYGWQGLPVDGVRAVALSSAGPASLDCWVVRSDGTLQRSRSGPDGAWSAWQPLGAPDGLRVVSVAAAPRGDGLSELVAVTSDGSLLHRREEPEGWGDWRRW
jgi:hypothetical protein